jgi:hypothetical protein
MDYTFRKFLSIFIVLCVLAIGGIAQAQSAEHAGHHAQHQAATHGTVLCSWMCAAGTVIDSEVVFLQTERHPVALVPLAYSSSTLPEPARLRSSRAPPSCSF